MEEQKTSEISSCKNSVMSRIECGELCPRSKTFFRTRECLVWVLWLFSVVVGALAVAVTFFVVAHRQYALYEATHDNFYTFMIDVLPFVWVVLFGLMIVIGVYNLRHTKRGYRYPMWQIIGSSLVLSLAGGALLHVIGFGYRADHMLGERMGNYKSQEKIEARLWQNAKEGRLIGMQKQPVIPPSTTLTFTDIEGKDWTIFVDDLSREEIELLGMNKRVKMIGVLKDSTLAQFHSCGVFPWGYGPEMNRDDMYGAREAFMQKMHSFEERAERVAFGSSEEVGEKEDLCTRMPSMRRPLREVTP